MRHGRRLASLRRASLRRASLAKGITVTVTVPGDGRLSATAKRAGRTVASAAAKRVFAGRRTLTLRFARKARRSLRRDAKLAVTVRFAPASGAAQTTKLSVKLR